MVQKKMSELEIEAVALDTGAALSQGKKVSVRIPEDKKHPENRVVPVGINGYLYYIRRGESVEVPAAVAKILEQAGYLQ